MRSRRGWLSRLFMAGPNVRLHPALRAPPKQRNDCVQWRTPCHATLQPAPRRSLRLRRSGSFRRSPPHSCPSRFRFPGPVPSCLRSGVTLQRLRPHRSPIRPLPPRQPLSCRPSARSFRLVVPRLVLVCPRLGTSPCPLSCRFPAPSRLGRQWSPSLPRTAPLRAWWWPRVPVRSPPPPLPARHRPRTRLLPPSPAAPRFTLR